MGRISNLWVLTGLVLLAISFCDFNVSADVIPSENECRPYIEKAIHELKNVETTGTHDTDSNESNAGDSDGSIEPEAAPETGTEDDGNESKEDLGDQNDSNESAPEVAVAKDNNSKEDGSDDTKSAEDNSGEQKDHEDNDDSNEVPSDKADTDAESGESNSEKLESTENDTAKNQTEDTDDDGSENESATADDNDDSKQQSGESVEAAAEAESDQANDGSNEKSDEQEGENAESLESATGENTQEDENSNENDGDSKETDSKEAADGDSNENDTTENNDEESTEEKVRSKRSIPDETAEAESDESNSLEATTEDVDGDSQEKTETSENSEEDNNTAEAANTTATNESGSQEADTASDEAKDEETDEDDLTIEFEIPKNLRPRGHVSDLLGLDAESSIKENALRKTGDVILKELKKVFDNAVKPLELMYKYRDLSNRHFGDPEIFSKPLILFMGPWSGGKSTILNYLTGNEYTPNSIRSGAEPSPAYFNILMHGDEPEVLDGTQLAADWTFSGLQKFGQGLMDRLRGQKLPSKLLERVNIVEIPGILEVRKQVSRYFPFNDACQWFIDRADIIFLVYDPSKLDVGPETEAILDQLKGREYQTRILLNKADQVKPEELLRVQGALIWNISPLMSSAQPPIMYTVSLWSHPFASGAPIRLLQAQERAFLVDLREAIDRRIENKIASARRFAVRIRNHAKMVDCYLTTYYNQKGLFSNKKQVADKIIEHPQNFNIYEGLSTLTNISRYDLPDPEVYLDFFRLNPLYEFKKLSETCTYFKGCPINKLDIAIAYELPELVGKYKKIQEMNMVQLRKEYDDNCNVTEPELPVKIINSR